MLLLWYCRDMWPDAAGAVGMPRAAERTTASNMHIATDEIIHRIRNSLAATLYLTTTATTATTAISVTLSPSSAYLTDDLASTAHKDTPGKLTSAVTGAKPASRFISTHPPQSNSQPSLTLELTFH